MYVFDSSTRQQASGILPTLGYMNIAGYPACSPPIPNTTCYFNSYMTVSPDGNTVFIAGSSNLIVVPVANPILTHGDEGIAVGCTEGGARRDRAVAPESAVRWRNRWWAVQGLNL